MKWDEVRDLTGAYALGSMSPEEKRQIKDQLEDEEDNPVPFVKEAGGDWVRIEATLGQVGSTVSLGGFGPLASDSAYQLWAVRDETAISLRVFNTDDDGNWSGEMEFARQRGDQIAITKEAHGGSNAPTMGPLLPTKI